ncbi:histidine-type phosphatase [Rhodococcus sp. ARC_M6]|uniref:histidine-type phosphatase n=1 Tax=Rhodococcus sp. ARC_M6 TaxID=2928852 RepID=UPI001FB4CD4D|nr:histidine-type phosphatase [Rhodococcus sp. ARC_M6]MCJ0906855.1 histidine phosphatase family protein [Rhodococcus sp. ARC_M6]
MRSPRFGLLAAAGAVGLMLVTTGTAASSAASPFGSVDFSSSSGSSDAAGTPAVGGFTSKTPYSQGQRISDLQSAPAGFTPVYTENVARHGSRALSSLKYDDLSLQLWEIADAENALTSVGKDFGPELRKLMAANNTLGYGNLSGLGITEHRELGARVTERLPQLFGAIAAQDGAITLTSSGVDRAVDSAANFGQGLSAAYPDVAGNIGAVTNDPDVLYFHDSDDEYKEYEDSDPRLEAVDEEISNLPRTREVSRHMMTKLYSESFVDRLVAGEFSLVDRGKGSEKINDEVDAAYMLYNTYIITPGMGEEGDWNFGRFIDQDDAQWLAYTNDAEDFYAKGPGFAGEDVTYRMATVLRDEFLAGLKAHTSANTLPGADFRFAHAETIIPFAALLKLPGSTVQQPEGELYTYANNPWRGEHVSPMAANISWDVYSGPDNAQLVRMLYNERETAFAEPCTPVASGSFFYTPTELERCLPEISRQ